MTRITPLTNVALSQSVTPLAEDYYWCRMPSGRKRFESSVPDQLQRKSENAMKPKAHTSDDLRPEYQFDYSKAVRGKYYKRILKEGANVVVLEPDVARAFPDSASVNSALRVVLKAGEASRRPTRRSTGRAKSARR